MKKATEPVLCGLLLAAGDSARLGQPKQLVQLDGESLLSRIVDMLQPVVADLVVVTGACAPEVGQYLQSPCVRIIHNGEWQAGMGGSIATGMRGAGDGMDGVLIMLGDLWRVDNLDLQRLIADWRQEPDIVASACWDGNLGPPVIFPSHLFDELRQLSGAQGAKSVVGQQSRIRRVEIPNASFDLDTGADLQFMRDWISGCHSQSS